MSLYAQVTVNRHNTPTEDDSAPYANRFVDSGDIINIDMTAADVQLTARIDRTGALNVHVWVQGVEVSTFRRPDRH